MCFLVYRPLHRLQGNHRSSHLPDRSFKDLLAANSFLFVAAVGSIRYILRNICEESFLCHTFFYSSKWLRSVFMTVLKAASGVRALGEV